MQYAFIFTGIAGVAAVFRRCLLLPVAATALFGAATTTADTQPHQQAPAKYTMITEGYTTAVEQWPDKAKASRDQTLARSRSHDPALPAIWIVGIGTQLFADRDHDGYFAGFSVLIDVDIDYGHSDVYATLYLQGGAASPALLHTTHTFTVYGTSVADEYRVDIELLDHFIAAHYNIRIDVHDAWTGQLVDSVSAREFSNLRGLPLESDDFQTASHWPAHHAPANDDYLAVEYAGFLSQWFLLTLATWTVIRRRQARIIREGQASR